MKKTSIVFIFFLLIIGLSACGVDNLNSRSLESDGDGTAFIEAAGQEEMITEPKSSDIISPQASPQLDDEKSALEERIINDLYSRMELAPFSGVLGGRPYFHDAKIISLYSYDGLNWRGFVFTGADDGHIGGSFIYHVTIDENDDIHWRIISGDMMGHVETYEESFITGRQRILLLTDTLSYDPSTGLLQFIVPDMPEDALLYLRLFIDSDGWEDPICVFKHETENFNWKSNETYTHQFDPYTFQEIRISVGLVPKDYKDDEDVLVSYLSFVTRVTIDKNGTVDVFFNG